MTIRRKPAVNAAVEEVSLASQGMYLLGAGLSCASPWGSAALLACTRASIQNMTKLLKDPFFSKEGEASSSRTERRRPRERG